MCLKVINRKIPKNKKYIYKRVYIYNNKVKTIWQDTIVKPGWFRSKKSKKDNLLYNIIYGGVIHAYTNLKKAKNIKSFNEFIIKCIGYPKDFIANGENQEIAYTKIFVPKSEIDRIKKLHKKYNEKL